MFIERVKLREKRECVDEDDCRVFFFTFEQSIEAPLHRFVSSITIFSLSETRTGNRTDPKSFKSHFRFFSSVDFRLISLVNEDIINVTYRHEQMTEI